MWIPTQVMLNLIEGTKSLICWDSLASGAPYLQKILITYIFTTDWESIVVHQTMLTQPRLLSKNKWNKPGHPFWNLGSKIKQTRIQSQISNFDGVDSDAPWSWYQSWSNQDTPSGLPPQVEKLGSYSTHNPSRDFRRTLSSTSGTVGWRRTAHGRV